MTQIRTARPVLAIAAFIAGGLLAQPVLAGTPAAPTQVVRLDAKTLAGGDSAVRARIAAAARKVCRAENDSAAARLAARECYTQAVHSGEVQLAALRLSNHAPQQALAVTDLRPVR